MIIGLTGSIASGKSTVCAMLKQLGAFVIDADKIAHQVVLADSDVGIRLIDRFGEQILSMGCIDRAKLAEVAFADQDSVNALNRITHPEIISRIRTEVKRALAQAEVVVIEAPLLFEAGLDDEVDEVWLVVAKKDQQIDRAVRRGHNRADVVNRLKRQIPQAEKEKRSDVIIDNSGPMANTRSQVGAQWGRIHGQG